MVDAFKKREALALLAIVILTAAVGFFFPRALPIVRAAENWASDVRQAVLTPPRAQNEDIVVLIVTEKTLAALPYRSPLDRTFIADVVETLAAAKPAAIGLDILFDQPTEPAKDELLRATLAGLSVPVVVGFADRSSGLTEKQVAFLSAFTEGLRTGLVNVIKDRDGTVRELFPGRREGQEWRPGFASALAGIVGVVTGERALPMAYHGRPDGDTKPFRIFPVEAARYLPQGWFAGKVVLIGADLPHQDRHRTPFAAFYGTKEGGELPGVIIHAHALAQLVDGRTLSRTEEGGEMLLVLVLAALGVAFALVDLPLPLKGPVYLVSIVAFWGAGFALYRYGGPLIPLVLPTLTFTAAAGSGIAYLGRRDRQQKKFIREAFSRYVSPAIVDQLVADPGQLKVGGERREMTYLFTDLANFTALTERTPPEILVSLLNDYLGGMCAIAFEHGATLDKIVGDAVVGFFNAPVDQPDHPRLAVTCALALDDFGQEFVRRQKSERGLEVGITRIGVHSGTATIGNFGGDVFFDYTAHGDMVNTAARLESVNKHLGTRICVSGVTAAQCTDMDFRPVGSLLLKGKRIGIEVFEPLSGARAVSPAVAAYREAFELLRRNDPGAREAFAGVLRLAENDPLAAFHLRRLENGETGISIVMGEK